MGGSWPSHEWAGEDSPKWIERPGLFSSQIFSAPNTSQHLISSHLLRVFYSLRHRCRPRFPTGDQRESIAGNKQKAALASERKKENNNKSTKHVPPFNFKQTAAVASERKRKQRQINKRCPTFQFLHHNKDPLWRFEHSLQVDNTLKKSWQHLNFNLNDESNRHRSHHT